ncbi:MAG TPA: hypothetical protein VIV12_27380 [Streptosporangiaceae bacterium]
MPSHYPVPTDGPVGEMLRATRRDTYRPAHIHFLVTAPEHHPVTTHFFVAGSRYLDSDAVFAVKQSLVREFSEIHDADEAGRFGAPVPFWRATTDVVLQPIGG